MKRNKIFAGLLSAGILLSAPVAIAATPLNAFGQRVSVGW